MLLLGEGPSPVTDHCAESVKWGSAETKAAKLWKCSWDPQNYPQKLWPVDLQQQEASFKAYTCSTCLNYAKTFSYWLAAKEHKLSYYSKSPII